MCIKPLHFIYIYNIIYNFIFIIYFIYIFYKSCIYDILGCPSRRQCVLCVEEKYAKGCLICREFLQLTQTSFLLRKMTLLILLPRYGQVTMPMICEQKCWAPYLNLAHKKYSNQTLLYVYLFL